MPVHDVGRLLSDWRRRRRMSQFDLACAAEISTKHLSLLETGRSRPSRQMMLRLATTLQVPLRDRNALLAAAGFATTFQEHPFNAPALDVVRRNVESLLATHAPNPALAVDRHWTMLTANRAVAHLVAGAEPMLLRPPVNVLRLFLHPAGLASRIVNLAQWRAHTIERLRRQIDASGDPVLTDLLEEVRDYTSHGTDRPEDDAVALPLQLATLTAFCRSSTPRHRLPHRSTSPSPNSPSRHFFQPTWKPRPSCAASPPVTQPGSRLRSPSKHWPDSQKPELAKARTSKSLN